MNTALLRKKLAEIALGFRVDKAAANLPQTAAAAIFTIATGRVLVTLLIGEVSTIIQTQANTTKITINPTTGTSGDVASGLDISADEVGTHYIVEGDGTALVGTNAGTGWGAVSLPFIVPIGGLDLDCSASNTGQVKWTVFYLPIDDGAVVTAA